MPMSDQHDSGPLRRSGLYNHRVSDRDDDGLPDSWESRYGTDCLWGLNPLGDLDKDGRTNRVEWRLGTDPKRPDRPGSIVEPGEATDGKR